MATNQKQDSVWDKAKKIPGKDPEKYRQDPYGNTMNRDSFGNNTVLGWEIDHIKPTARGGSDDIRNLQALKTEVNRSKSDSLVKKSRHSKGNK